MKQLKNRLAEHVSIKSRKEDRRLTQRVIAEEAGLSQPTVGLYMRNEVTRTNMEVIAKFCLWLNIHPSQFFTWVETEDDDQKEENTLLAISA